MESQVWNGAAEDRWASGTQRRERSRIKVQGEEVENSKGGLCTGVALAG